MPSELNFPSFEAIGDETPKPILLPTWYEAYKYGFSHHPQTIYGLATVVGKAVTASLTEGTTDLFYAVRSNLADSQFEDLKNATVRAHNAYGITVMPDGLAKSGQTEFDAYFWLKGTWSDIKRSFVRALAYTAADAHPQDIDRQISKLSAEIRNNTMIEYDIQNAYTKASTANELSDKIKRERDGIEWSGTQSLAKTFQESPEYQTTLPLVTHLYEVSAQALETDEAKELSRRRRERYNKKKLQDASEGYYAPTADNYELQIIKIIKENLDNVTSEMGVSDEKVYNFLNAVTNIPRSTLKEQLPRAIPETRRKDATKAIFQFYKG